MDEMTKEEVLRCVHDLWQITQTANQPAQVHIQCQQLKDRIVEYICGQEKAVSEGGPGHNHGDVPSAARGPMRETAS